MIAPFKLGAVTVELIQSFYGLSSTVNAAVRLLLIGELAANCALFALAIYALAKLKGQKQQFPMIYITLFGASIVVMIADQLAAYYLLNLRPDDKELRTALVTVAAFGIWGPYMLYSKRVRNTFVN